MYSIGMFSKMYQVTPKALRHYDEIGLLAPSFVDEATGYRYYEHRQARRLRRILDYKRMGFSLPEIMQIIDLAPDSETLASRMQKKRRETLEHMEEEGRRLERIETFLRCGTGEAMQNYEVELKEIPECIVASMRRVIPNYDALFDLMPNVMGPEMERLGCECAQPAYCFNICHDREYKETDIDMELCEAVVEAKQDSELVRFKTIPALPVAVCISHYGGYDTLRSGYAYAAEWIERNGYELAGPPRESYIDGIWNKEKEAEWLTVLQFPVKKAK